MQDSGNAMVRTFFNKKIKQIYSLGAQLSPTVNGIVKDILKSIIVAFLCWLAGAIYTEQSRNIDGSYERLERFFMYSDLNYPEQILISSLNRKEQLLIAKEILNISNKNPKIEYVTDIYQLKFTLKPKDIEILQNKIKDIEAANRNIERLWVCMPIFVIFLVRLLTNNKS